MNEQYPVYRVMLGTDIRDSSARERCDSLLPELRAARLGLIGGALAAYGITSAGFDLRNRGDGDRYDFVAGVSPVPVIEAVSTHLPPKLRAYNKRVAHALRLELRLVVHGGYMMPTADGGDADGGEVNLLHRMLDSDDLKAALARSAAPWVLAVSEPIWRGAAQHGHGQVDAESFTPLTLTHRNGECPVWVTPAAPDQAAGLPEPGQGAQGFAAPPAARGSGDDDGQVTRDSVVFNGDVRARNIVGRDEWRVG
ncbi:hypothetical protein [Streptomyces adelaidensis]|uniref:hypothetical protein n=1 Tax=Streptomyces adelaidensis TaxID=2796465 RepID=UPI00190394D0|nr:hypothetical protein [Streptomyces adelaidensis]